MRTSPNQDGSGLLQAAGAGLSSAVFGLALAEFVAALIPKLRSPVIDVGDRVVDLVPPTIKNIAISVFGTNDKIVLLIGIGVVIAAYAAAIGVVAFRRGIAAAFFGLGLFSALGAAASLFTRTGLQLLGPVPTLVGSLATALALAFLVRHFGQTSDRNEDPMRSRPNDRRRFLAGIGALTAAGATLTGASRHISSRETGGSNADQRLVGQPKPVRPLETPPEGIQVANAAPFFTPNEDFYRIDTALVVPRPTIDSWELSVSGLVDSPAIYGFEDLIDGFDVIESDITLTCVSNTVGGFLVGTARWMGIRLDELLDRAGVDASADQIVGRSVDGYTCGFPVSALDGRDALVAFGMNGEPLPPEHGYPARLIVPGLYGYVSATKWLTEIELTTFDAFDHYWVPRGYASRAPIKQQSRIDSPRGLDRIPAGRTAIAGVAWAQTIGIEAVEVRIDDATWVEADLADELNDSTWRQWSLPWNATPGRHTITVRCRDKNGTIQTDTRSEPLPDGASGHHTIVVLVDA